ncbi:DUF2523 family protein [Cellvibrio sp. UBA7661]|uniref:DUF2523 family protein n=1 Tax=Cellvibrio sp. UBA7661 TaxID=1946311 RepID=UPI002F34FF12
MIPDVMELLNSFVELINELPAKSDSYWERIVLWIIISYIELKVVAIDFAWGFASSILSAVGVSQSIQQAWSFVSPDMASVLSYLRIPDAINLVMNAYITRFILGLLP